MQFFFLIGAKKGDSGFGDISFSLCLFPVFFFHLRGLARRWRDVHLWGQKQIWKHPNRGQNQCYWPWYAFIRPFIAYFRDNGRHSKLVHIVLFFLIIISVSWFHLPAEPPLLARGAPVIITGIGQSLSIPCMLLDGIPLPERYWSLNGRPVRVITTSS